MQFSRDDSAQYIASILGERLKRVRLNLDRTQEEVASKAWVSRRAVMNAEKGEVTLENLVAIMRALEMTNNLNIFIPAPSISPIQLLKMKGNIRKKASGGNKKIKEASQSKPSDW
ncbi:helix-turn-helix transcriptional regulator [Acinetobacter sp. ASP199]|uniref:helix-turn-helix transcriptional regulator n=1 Tax=unclassified Acinetobacter TaxID=196816 RepID=UPI001F624F16|nr:helix-turn-helix transcriptional regulator [Acinetobacter sp. ASP199]UNT58087.1 helix-turn-helix domain-containing protein [Acinetobacter sp. ASP199]